MKTAIVTGGAHGIGKGIALKLAEENIRVIVLDNNPQYLKELASEELNAGNRLHTFRCDVGHPDEIEKTIAAIGKQFKSIDYIVNNAGVSYFEALDTMSIETWNRILSVNLSSIFYLVKYTQAFLSDQSAIVNIASSRALMSEAHTEAYSASKGGIVALTHSLAISLGPKTRVNCISPGWIEVNDYANLTSVDHKQHPAGRVGQVNDIAEMVSFLLSDKSGFITGQNFVIDGGMTKKMIYTDDLC